MRRHLKRVGNVVLAGCLMLGIAACGAESMAPQGIVSAPAPTGVVEADKAVRGYAAMSEATVTTGSTMSDTEERALAPAAAIAAPATRGATTGEERAPLSTGRTAPQADYQSTLTAGQVDDNAKFDEYLQYLREAQYTGALPIDVEQRMFVRVLDGAQKPVAGARVQLFDGQRQVFDGRTVSDGRVLFFPREADAGQAQELRALVEMGNHRVEAKLQPSLPEQTAIMDLQDNSGPVGLDIVFLMDATGSMADEIDQLKATVGTIASRIEQLPGSSKPRLGLVAFRDRGDDYVTRSWDFTADVGQFQSNLANVSAGGGGDNPEAVSAGLQDALNLPGWSGMGNPRQLRLIVLVGDAPPHLDYPNDPRYTDLLRQAVASGIKIFPIGASNLDNAGEYIFRQFAQVTQGQFIFLTYENGVAGAPGTATDKHVPAGFTVRNLDSLVVSLVAGEVANQTGQPVQGLNPVPVEPMKAAPGGWLARLDAMVQGAVDRLTSATTLFWLAALVLAVLVARRTPQRARVAALAMPHAQPAGEFDLPHNNVEDDWASEAAEARWRLESDAELYGNMTVQVAPGRPRRGLPQGTGEPTLPLGALPFSYRHTAEEVTGGDGRQKG